jgi:heat shock protein HtpX
MCRLPAFWTAGTGWRVRVAPGPGIASHLAHSWLPGTGGTLRAVKNTFKTFVLLAGLGGLLVIIGQLLGGYTGALIGLAIGLVLVGFSYWKSDTLAIRAARAVPVTEEEMPEYYAIVRELTQQAGMPMPKLYVTPDQQPNAFATGRNPEHAAVAVTQGILRILNWDQLRGVLAHEISHVGNRDILIGSVAAAIAVGITAIATFLRFSAIFGGRDDEGGNPIALLALAILAPIAAVLLQAALSRSREFEADRSGARLIGDGEPLAQALQKLEAGAHQIPMDIDPAHASAFIVNPLAGRKMSFGNLWRTHPPTEDRVARLRGGEWR